LEDDEPGGHPLHLTLKKQTHKNPQLMINVGQEIPRAAKKQKNF
jgi:hypothetical protein